MLRCREGDAAALDQLLQRWQERLWRHALRRTGEEAAAWDVLQEVCLVIARDVRKLENDASFAVWAYRITDHKSHDWVRQHVRRRQREAAFTERRQINQAKDPEFQSKASELIEAFPRLSPADRTLLTLRFQDEFTIEEMAEMLHVPGGTVKSRLYHAKNRLRQLMENRHERDNAKYT